MKKDLMRTMRDFDARIRRLEALEKAQAVAQEALAKSNQHLEPPPQMRTVAAAPIAPAPPVALNAPAAPEPAKNTGVLGDYEPGRGLILARSSIGEVSFSVLTYLRYLNQNELARTYTDSFGRTFTLNLRQDVMLNKANITFKGWLLDPNFTFRVWTWTQNAAMGNDAQVVVGGHMQYHFADSFNFAAGLGPVPSTRSTNWSYPFWLKVDNRTIADEFFRGSYTFGIWADGKLGNTIGYRAMIANNLSALGVNASELAPGLNTQSVAVWWMPTTGEFGPALGFGDYEDHQDLATMFGVHFTRSREDKQDQPSVNAFDNSQIRLSDGTLLFSPNAFNTDAQVNKATYQMLDIDAGFKYLGWSLESEYYARWVNEFETTGHIPVSNLFDQGFQLQASAMVIPKQWQAYVSGSEIIGQYGDPWDFSVGLNWFPFLRRELRWNAQATYLDRSPVGGVSYPYIVGGKGWFFNTDLLLAF